jgi:hypothetical protein
VPCPSATIHDRRRGDPESPGYEFGFFAAAALLNSVAQAAENLLRSRLLLMQSCISEPARAPQSLRASFLQSCDTELLDEDEDGGEDAEGGDAVCASAYPAIATEATSARDKAFIFIPSFIASGLKNRFAIWQTCDRINRAHGMLRVIPKL